MMADNKFPKPLVSIIIPTKNRAPLLKRAIQSVIAQIYTGWELIVIDDASFDNSAQEVVKEFKNDQRRIIFKKNHTSLGGAQTRNIGIKLASGEVIAFLDDDDEWLPEKLKHQISILSDNHNVGLVGCWYFYIHANKTKRLVKLPESINFKALLIENYLGSFSFVAVKKNLLDQHGLLRPDMKSSQDWELWLRLAPHTKIYIANKPLVNYYETPSGRISSSTKNAVESLYKILKRYDKQMPFLIKLKHLLWLRLRHGGLYNFTRSKYLIWPYQRILRILHTTLVRTLEGRYLKKNVSC